MFGYITGHLSIGVHPTVTYQILNNPDKKITQIIVKHKFLSKFTKAKKINKKFFLYIKNTFSFCPATRMNQIHCLTHLFILPACS